MCHFLSSLFFFWFSKAIADTPSFIFLWVGDGVGLEQGRACLKKVSYPRLNYASAVQGVKDHVF
jgi:hypothetical protein